MSATATADPAHDSEAYHEHMDTEDDELQVVYETKKHKSRPRGRRHKKNRVPEPEIKPEPILVDDDSDVEELESIPSSTPPLQQRRRDDTVVLSDSDDELKDIDEADYSTSNLNAADFEDTDENGALAGAQGLEDSMQTEAEQDTDASEIQDVTPPELVHAANVRFADELKKSGNDFFLKHEYHKALEMYRKAIEILPSEAPFYANRSACYMMMKKYKEAQADAKIAIQVDPTFEKGYLRLLRSALALGDVIGTEGVLQTIDALPNFTTNIAEEKRKLEMLKSILADCATTKDKKDYRKLIYLCDRALQIASGDLQLKVLKADALLRLNRAAEAQEICTEVLQADSKCVEAYYIRSVCLYEADNMEKAIQFLRQALQFAPDSGMIVSLFRKMKKIKDVREEATVLFTSKKYREAQDKFLDCMRQVKEFDFPNVTIESKMSLNLSLIAFNLKEHDEALKLVNRAIELNPSYLKAFMHRATVHQAKEMFEESVRDYEAAQKLDPSKTSSYRKYIQDAKMAAKRASRKDYYKILGIEKNASADEVKKAYKKRCLVHHPDRHAGATDAVQKDQERQFKEVGQAYEILSDPKKRSRYDAGHDLLDPSDHSGFGGFSHGGDFDTASFFNAFFTSEGMGGGHSRGGGGGYSHHHRPHSSYHPF